MVLCIRIWSTVRRKTRKTSITLAKGGQNADTFSLKPFLRAVSVELTYKQTKRRRHSLTSYCFRGRIIKSKCDRKDSAWFGILLVIILKITTILWWRSHQLQINLLEKLVVQCLDRKKLMWNNLKLIAQTYKTTTTCLSFTLIVANFLLF